jgi:proteasome lid subunit RPN8/RPN11
MVGHKVPLVIPVTPAELLIDRQALTVLRTVLAQPAPREGCALLLGCRAAAAAVDVPPGGHPASRSIWRLLRIWPCLNVWDPAEERRRRFRIDPREQLQAQKWGRCRGLEVLGAAHSHPAGRPFPSATDLALTLGPTLMLILAGGETPDRLVGGEIGCWWLPEPQPLDPQAPGAAARPLVWRMED